MNNKDNCAYYGINLNQKEIYIPYFRHLTDLKVGDLLIVETNRGQEFGSIVYYYNCCRNSKRQKDVQIKKVIRKANEEDLATIKKCHELEKEYKLIINNLLNKLKLASEVKTCKIELLFDQKTLYIFLKRINEKQNRKKIPIKEIINELRKELQLNVFVEEISERNFAQKIGGMGVCGYPLCCKTFINKLGSISIKFAREQNLSINLQKLSGQCSKLKCCIKYEKENYEEGKLDPEFLKHSDDEEPLL